MDEHDDDLAPEVEDEVAEEQESFPDDPEESDDDIVGAEPVDLDEDESEL
jgi:hypothetical protein